MVSDSRAELLYSPTEGVVCMFRLEPARAGGVLNCDIHCYVILYQLKLLEYVFVNIS